MDTQLIVSESASGHPDGTFSVLRGGITRIWGPPDKPVKLDLALVVRVSFEASEHGDHKVSVALRDRDGKRVMPAISGNITVPERAVSAPPLIIRMQGMLAHGQYEFDVAVDGQQRVCSPLHVTLPPAAAAPGTKVA